MKQIIQIFPDLNKFHHKLINGFAWRNYLADNIIMNVFASVKNALTLRGKLVCFGFLTFSGGIEM